jgi:hypothetical protein
MPRLLNHFPPRSTLVINSQVRSLVFLKQDSQCKLRITTYPTPHHARHQHTMRLEILVLAALASLGAALPAPGTALSTNPNESPGNGHWPRPRLVEEQ